MRIIYMKIYNIVKYLLNIEVTSTQIILEINFLAGKYFVKLYTKID